MEPLEQTVQRLKAERRVRALAEAGSTGTPSAWAGSTPTLLSFERGLSTLDTEFPLRETEAGVVRLRFPYESLETWQDWGALQATGPLSLLAHCRPVYDPSGSLGSLQRTLQALTPPQLADFRAELINQAETRLGGAQQLLVPGSNTASGTAAQLLVLADVRRLAAECLYPALLSWRHLWAAGWPDGGVRLPHLWRAQVGLAFPRAVNHLDQLYGFGGEREARRVLLATRGLNLVQVEKRARLASQVGYFDGAVRFVRDAAAQAWRGDLERWPYLSGARQDKLVTLLGAEISPLGPVAAELCRELIEDVRAGR